MSLESLATIRKRYSISTKYVLHTPAPGQHPYNTCPEGLNISIDTLEARLRFPLHPIIEECLPGGRYPPASSDDAVGNSPGVHRELTEGIRSLPGWCKGVHRKKTETRWKIVKGSRKTWRELERS
ncbi:hypothetical protein BHM03_00062730 [Ensete ventricosum]|nr:hypothetical protein BHM03_00062730 [Ensete ventricosum]